MRLEEFWALSKLPEGTVLVGPVGEIDVAPLLAWRETEPFAYLDDSENVRGRKGNGKGTGKGTVKGTVTTSKVLISIIGDSPFAAPDDLVDQLEQYPVGLKLLVLVAGEPGSFMSSRSFARIIDKGLRLEAAAWLSYEDIAFVMLGERVKPNVADDPEDARRILSQSLLPGLYEDLRFAREHIADLARLEGSTETAADLRVDNALLQRELEITRARLHALSSRLDHVERSATWRLGSLMTDVGRNPMRLPQATRQAMKIWRGRRESLRSGKSHTGAVVSAVSALNGQQLLGNYPLRGIENEAVVAVVAQPSMARELSEEFAVVSLSPHDAEAKLETARPKFFVIDQQAADPNCVWCYLASPSALDKDKAVLRAIERARALGTHSLLIKRGREGDWSQIEAAVDVVLELQASDAVVRRLRRAFEGLGAAS